MTPTEYNDWLGHAMAAYPEIANQFKGDAGIDRSEIWQEALSGVDATVATEAINAMVAGTTERPQYGWSDLPRFIRDYARDAANAEMQRVQVDGDGRGERCPKCHDVAAGVAIVWNPWFVFDCGPQISLCSCAADVWSLWRSWSRGQDGSGGALRLSVLCNCESPVASRKRARLEEWRSKSGDRKDHHTPACRDTYCEAYRLWVIGEPCEVA